jgi:peptide deformylase
LETFNKRRTGRTVKGICHILYEKTKREGFAAGYNGAFNIKPYHVRLMAVRKRSGDMALRQIRMYGDEILRKKSKPVKEINAGIITLLDDMLETLHDQNGLGLAALEPEDGKLLELINPEIISKRGKAVEAEGCLSVPGRFAEVARPKVVMVGTYDREGEYHKVKLEGLAARAACHEIDHLDGELFINKAIRYLTDDDFLTE